MKILHGSILKTHQNEENSTGLPEVVGLTDEEVETLCEDSVRRRRKKRIANRDEQRSNGKICSKRIK